MSLNLDTLNVSLHEHEKKLLENYKNLVTTYEDIRQNYENIIAEHEKVGSTILNTSTIVATNNALVVTQWALETLDGKRLFISGKYQRFDTMTLDLSTLNLIEGSQFKLKAVVTSGDDSLGIEVIQYEPQSNTVMYSLSGNAFKTTLKLTSVIPPTTL